MPQVGGGGDGDMTKAIYDTDNDGKVDASEVADALAQGASVLMSQVNGLNEALADKQNTIDENHKLPYSHISGTPTIPEEVTEQTVSEWGFTKNTGTYSKPLSGIPDTDLAESVQESLEKADSALQSETDPTVPAWAKQENKPTYTAEEVGALPNTTAIPSALSDLSDDSTHRTATDNEKAAWNAKQESISDLETIRSGAALGATALQEVPNTYALKTYVDTAIQTAVGTAIGGEY